MICLRSGRDGPRGERGCLGLDYHYIWRVFGKGALTCWAWIGPLTWLLQYPPILELNRLSLRPFPGDPNPNAGGRGGLTWRTDTGNSCTLRTGIIEPRARTLKSSLL